MKHRYCIIGLVGRGGTGTVYRADDNRLPGRKLAIKERLNVTAETRGANPDRGTASAMFIQEAQMLARLFHPNLPAVHDFFEIKERQYIVMEFVEGDTLERIYTRAVMFLPVPFVVGWGVQLCDVLAYLHAHSPPIIYRDLKPANVILEHNGQIKLVDFSIARRYQAGQIRDTRVMGTAGYAPPEQYGSGQINARSDVYSLGATLHQLLTLQDPQDHSLVFEPPHDVNPAVSPALSQVVMRALQSEPDHRWQEVNHLRAALIDTLPAGMRRKWEQTG